MPRSTCFLASAFLLAAPVILGAAEPVDAEAKLVAEVRSMGWVAYGARSTRGDWDLFACRPDGSGVRPLTRTPHFSEFSPQFSRDGRKLLYRRVPTDEKLDNNRHGEQGELVLADADGSSPVGLAPPGELPWASFNPDGTQIASLSLKGIRIFSLERREVVRTWPRKGFFQQVTWSPDGKWLCGVANSFGASWSIARMDVTTGEAGAVNVVDCCTPDWFPDAQHIIFSWRVPGQKINQDYGWTQLWRAATDGSSRELVYAEQGRHVYGGHVSPDGQYALFTGNIEEDGDPGRAGAPMGLMRLSDAPIVGGVSEAFRAQHPGAKSGPVLTLPVGWEPCWTFARILPGAESVSPDAGHDARGATGRSADAPSGSAPTTGVDKDSEQSVPGNLRPSSDDLATLRAELRDRGWLAFSARAAAGDWDLFLMRPDGSERRPLTATSEFNEAGARFSPDGQRLLYYRLPRSEPVDNNAYGTFDLVLADADGSAPRVLGDRWQWASWGPDSRQIACLTSKSIQIVDVATRAVVREFPRRGIVSQLVSSPDGKHFVGTANGLGPFWNIGVLDSAGKRITAISETERYNCTPDWTPDSQRVIYARGIIPEEGGRAEAWVASADGKQRQTLYTEAGRHIYGACASPDGRYLLFTRSVEDLGSVDHEGTTIAIIRWSDAPMAGDEQAAKVSQMSAARRGPRLDLGHGWEPHWTAAEVTATQKAKRP